MGPARRTRVAHESPEFFMITIRGREHSAFGGAARELAKPGVGRKPRSWIAMAAVQTLYYFRRG